MYIILYEEENVNNCPQSGATIIHTLILVYTESALGLMRMRKIHMLLCRSGILDAHYLEQCAWE